jgi:hypothetical protein
MKITQTEREILEAHERQLVPLRAQFLREWNAEHANLPDSNEKAMKMLRDWQGFLNTKGYKPLSR